MQLKCPACCHDFKASIFDYQTNKIAVIRNTQVVYLLRLLQIGILGYVCAYTLYYKKGYQDTFGLSSSVVAKVKGFGLTNRTDITRKIWDIADSVVPPQEANAIFITTNVIETDNQTQGFCPESHSVANATCEDDSQCEKGNSLYLGNGIMTGRCVKNNGGKTCEIQAWCPLENDNFDTETPLLTSVLNYTVLIKNTVIFDEVNVQRSNLFYYTDERIPFRCLYDPKHKMLKYCPIFKISSFIGKINETDLTELLVYGGVIRIIITWNCNLDIDHGLCRPEYTFSKLFTKYGKFTKGWNFRYANYYERNNKEYRVLFKVYGIRILIEVRGKASKFSIFALSMNVGSGIALLTIATIVCDFIITSCLPKRDKYCQIIYETHDIKSKTSSVKVPLHNFEKIEEET